jgi:drug/metabolite transporter (DMT)-like permease
MEHLWILFGLSAVSIQTFRSSLMRHLRGQISDGAITLARFSFSVPFAALWLWGFVLMGYKLPQINAHFIIYALFAAILQLAGGFFFLALFSRRNYVIGITYSKIEALMVAIFGAVLFAEFISTAAAIAIVIGFIGIMIVSATEQNIEPQKLLKRIFSKSGQIGMVCGILFGLCSTFIHQAIIALEDGEFLTRSSVALLFMLVCQVIMLGIFMFLRDRKKIYEIKSVGKSALMLGFTNSLSSLGWFVAFSLTKAAYVSMLSQVEILFSIFITHRFFKEKISKLEIVGAMLVVVSVVLLVYAQ